MRPVYAGYHMLPLFVTFLGMPFVMTVKMRRKLQAFKCCEGCGFIALTLLDAAQWKNEILFLLNVYIYWFLLIAYHVCFTIQISEVGWSTQTTSSICSKYSLVQTHVLSSRELYSHVPLCGYKYIHTRM